MGAGLDGARGLGQSDAPEQGCHAGQSVRSFGKAASVASVSFGLDRLYETGGIQGEALEKDQQSVATDRVHQGGDVVEIKLRHERMLQLGREYSRARGGRSCPLRAPSLDPGRNARSGAGIDAAGAALS